jgi:hypothetical protein
MLRARSKSFTSFGPTVIKAKTAARPIVPTSTTYSVDTAPRVSANSDDLLVRVGGKRVLRSNSVGVPEGAQAARFLHNGSLRVAYRGLFSQFHGYFPLSGEDFVMRA